MDWLSHRWLTPVLAVRLIPITIVLVGGAGLTQWTAGLLRDQRALVVHTHQVIETSQDVLIILADAETGQRGYLITGDTAYLTPYAGADQKAGAVARHLAALVTDNAVQKNHMAQLQQLMADKLGELSTAVSARRSGGIDAAVALVRRDNGRALMDDIRREIAALVAVEERLLAQRAIKVRQYESRATLIAIVVGLIPPNACHRRTVHNSSLSRWPNLRIVRIFCGRQVPTAVRGQVGRI